ncbi:hypothetical protein D6783_05865 [Candidatus Woesearchaeota archaeon]|nr:MAG: hypothetical protein D6783_05865 [Candidatus Woesearchaeota archaeon]
METLKERIENAYKEGKDLLTLRNELINEGHDKQEIDHIIEDTLATSAAKPATPRQPPAQKNASQTPPRPPQPPQITRFLLFFLTPLFIIAIALIAYLVITTSPAKDTNDTLEEPTPPLTPTGYCTPLPGPEQDRCLREYILDGGVCLRLNESIRYACYRTKDIIILENYRQLSGQNQS